MKSREELIREMIRDVEKQDKWDEKKLISCKEKVLQRVLRNIEKESEFWDAEEMTYGYGLYELAENIYRSVCKSIYAEMHRNMGLPENILQICLEEAEEYFFYDCLLASPELNKETWPDEETSKEITFNNFYKKFAEFIKDVRELEVDTKEDTNDCLNQLKKMLQEDRIGNYIENRYSYICKERRKGKKGVNEECADMNVWMQTNRFWIKWVVTADKQSMRRQELIFWLLLATIYNFAEDFGSEEMTMAGKCLKYVRKVESADISEALQWAFKCVYQIIKNDNEAVFINYFGGSLISGCISLMDRFHYVQFDVKKRVWNYLEGLLAIPEKHFSSYRALYRWLIMWFIIRRESAGTTQPLIGKDKSNGKLSKDYRYICRHMRKIWKDFPNKYILENHYFKDCYGEDFDLNGITQEEDDRGKQDLNINRFILGEFLNLHSIAGKNGEWNYLFYLEMRLYLEQMFRLVNSGEITDWQYEETVKQFAEKREEFHKPRKAGRKKQQKDRLVEEDSEEQNDVRIKRLLNCIKRLLNNRRNCLLNNFEIVLYIEKKFINVYWIIISDIMSGKRVKVHSSLVSRLQNCIEIKESEQINIESDNYISWKDQDENNLSLILNLFMRSCCMEL